ncbi:MAG: sugar-binding protein, partial [Armatimonadota bacterium]
KGHIPVHDFRLDQTEFLQLPPKSETILDAGVKQKTEGTNSLPIIAKFPMYLEYEGQTVALGTATFSVPLSVHRISDVKADGNLEEWEARQWISIPGPVKGRQTHEGDATAKFAVGWDDNALYIAFDVHDDKFLQNFTGVQMWKGDSVQVAIDGMRDPGGNDGYDLNDYEFGVAQGPQGPQSFCWYGVLGMTRGPNPNIEYGIKTDDNRRTYEIAIPWTSIQALKPGNGRVFGLLTIINDSDEPGDAEKRGYLEWGGEIVNRKYTSGFYGARLVE